MRRGPLLLALLLSTGLSCRTRTLALRIELHAIPSDTAIIEASFTLGGRPAMQPERWTAPAGGFHEIESVVVNLPPDATGALQIAIQASDAQQCVAANGDGVIADATELHDVSLPLVVDGRAGCALVIGVTGAGGTVRFDGGTCNQSSCTFLQPRGRAVELTAERASGSVFTTWSGDCRGDGACKLTMDRPHFGDAPHSGSGQSEQHDPLGRCQVVWLAALSPRPGTTIS